MNKKVPIAILTVIAIVIVGGAVMTMSAVDHDVNDAKVECKYTMAEVESYTYQGILGPTVDTPDTGKKFIRITGTLSNNQDTWTVSNNPFNFKLFCDGLSYYYEHYNYHYGDIAKGHSASIDICFEVPSTVSKMELKWDGFENITMTKQ